MTRGFVLSVIALAGTISIASAAYQAPPSAPSPAALEATKIEKVRDNLYMITGSNPTNRDAFSGGNTAVVITHTRVGPVGHKLAGWGQGVLGKGESGHHQPGANVLHTAHA